MNKRLLLICTNLILLMSVLFDVELSFADLAEYLKHPGDETVVQVKSGISNEEVQEMSQGCLDCHSKTDAPSMHKNSTVALGCAHCHGGHPEVRAVGLVKDSKEYKEAKANAHVLPENLENWPNSANPQHSYTNLLKESAEFVKFVNPGDLRVARETCGGCHAKAVHAVERSLMTTSAMLWGGAAYNNNILPYKKYILGERYGRDGKPQVLIANPAPSEEAKARGALPNLIPLPTWEVLSPGDIFRVFERGGERIKTTFPEIGNPNPEEQAGKPDIRQSNRGPGTGNRIVVPVINIHKTRLNDPHLSLMGTNDHAGDYRSSGCSACHVVYANNRDVNASGPYAKYGNEGKTVTVDPTIPKDEEGHPLRHEFTRAIPTSACMVCHMHQPNMFVNTFLGNTMWDYEVDAPFMWPEKQKYPTIKEYYESMLHNPEEAAIRGKWTDKNFLKHVSEMNPELKRTQFADYHGHGWNFRAVFSKDRRGNLLDKNGKQISWDDPEKFKKAVHMQDIHVDFGMHCVDCHFEQDSHGDGNIYGEVAQQVEIQCEDCHGSVKSKANLKTTGPASATEGLGGRDLSIMRTQFGQLRFVWRDGDLYQRSSLYPEMEWRVKQVRSIIDPADKDYNPKAARAKTTMRLGAHDKEAKWGDLSKIDSTADRDMNKVLAHSGDNMSCFACHSSWTTACAGCHLPIQANWKKITNHYEGKETRNWASYNPQVARDEMYQLGRHGPAKNGRIVPVRSSSALILSSTDISRQKIYTQQPPTAASGHSSQAFAPHFPHTVRTKETKQCEDCHVSKSNDNNAIMAQLLLLGTNFVNFMGYHAYVATEGGGFEAIQVTEWDEPQSVIGSYLHKYAYPDWYSEHLEHGRELQTSHLHHGAGGTTNMVQLRGEYLFATAGVGGFRAYDVANVSNKGFSERLVTAPFSPLGHDTYVPCKNATSFALATNMPINPARKQLPENLEEPMHPIYHYAVITDSEEGLILVNVDTLQDGDPTNNFFERSLTWNPEGGLSGAQFVTLAGSNAFVLLKDSLVVVDLDDPLTPKIGASVKFNAPRSVAVQFRYAFVTDADGFHVVDLTNINKPTLLKSASIKMDDLQHLYVARNYAYVAGGRHGLVIVDVEKADKPKVYKVYDDEGRINDLRDVKVASTNASTFAYLADGKNGLKVLQLTDPERVPQHYGFAPPVSPVLVAWRKTEHAATFISKALDRDRAVDETGHQVSILGRIGSRPFNYEEMRKMYTNPAGELYSVENDK